MDPSALQPFVTAIAAATPTMQVVAAGSGGLTAGETATLVARIAAIATVTAGIFSAVSGIMSSWLTTRTNKAVADQRLKSQQQMEQLRIEG
jgi:hypothetical protein